MEDDVQSARPRWIRRIAFGVAIAYSAFHLYTGAVGSLPAMQQRSMHLLFAIVLVFLLRSSVRHRFALAIDLFLAVLSVVALGYITIEADALDARAGDYTNVDFAFGLIVTAL